MTYLTAKETFALNVISRSGRERPEIIRDLRGKARKMGEAIVKNGNGLGNGAKGTKNKK